MEEVFEKRSNLVIPTHYVELDSEEMSYVEGGKTTYYYGWNAIWTCFSALLGISVFKLGGSVITNIKALIKGAGPQLLKTVSNSMWKNILSTASGISSAFFWFRFAVYGTALIAGLISMAAAGSCKIGMVSIFGFTIGAFYAGV